ncbi:MAG TPA: hypothetical protein VGV67_02790 [Solirubrobacteraceae bacterium]|nr:hypothetical protein [Solirubrobacteraceae bacterium]
MPSEIAHEAAPRSRRWFDGLPPVTGEIRCGGQQHRITWRRGKLVLEDHDLLAERSLTALGSEPPLCVEVLEAWRRTRSPELLYEFLLREDTMPTAELELRRSRLAEAVRRMHTPPPMPPHAAGAWRQAIAASVDREKVMWDFAVIEALPRTLRRTLALSALVAFERQWHRDLYRRTHERHIASALTPITHALLEQSVRRWRRNLKPHATFATELRLLGPGEPPACAGWIDSGGAFAFLSLPISWFTDVWAQGIALVDGCFVLSRGDGSCDASSVRVLAVRWQREGGGISGARAAPAVVTSTADGEQSVHWI